MTRLLLAAAAALGLAPAALAQGTAQIANPGEGENARFAWRDTDTLRVGTDDPSGYLLVHEGSAYAVSTESGMDGPMVIDFATVQAMAQGMSGAGAMSAPSFDPYRAASVESVSATGNREQVAGIDGEVYQIAWTDAAGNAHTDTMVLSDDALAAEFTAAFYAFAEATGAGDDARAAELDRRGLGILRYGNDFELVSIGRDAPEADYFALPAEPMTMQDMMRGAMPN